MQYFKSNRMWIKHKSLERWVKIIRLKKTKNVELFETINLPHCKCFHFQWKTFTLSLENMVTHFQNLLFYNKMLAKIHFMITFLAIILPSLNISLFPLLLCVWCKCCQQSLPIYGMPVLSTTSQWSQAVWGGLTQVVRI